MGEFRTNRTMQQAEISKRFGELARAHAPLEELQALVAQHEAIDAELGVTDDQVDEPHRPWWKWIREK